jgi:hypothetical protein
VDLRSAIDKKESGWKRKRKRMMNEKNVVMMVHKIAMRV